MSSRTAMPKPAASNKRSGVRNVALANTTTPATTDAVTIALSAAFPCGSDAPRRNQSTAPGGAAMLHTANAARVDELLRPMSYTATVAIGIAAHAPTAAATRLMVAGTAHRSCFAASLPTTINPRLSADRRIAAVQPA